jgi:putative aldouronate transport system permease protein
MVATSWRSTGKMRQSNSDRFFDAVNLTLITVFFLTVAYPLVFVVVASVSDPDYVNTGQVFLLPRGLTLSAYAELLKAERIWIGYGNTVVYAGVGSLFAVSTTLGLAFALSRRELVGRRGLNMLVVFTMVFQGGIIPLFLVVRGLGLYNTRAWMIIHGMTTGFWIMIARTFFSGLSEDLIDSARLDGCNDIQYFLHIALGISKALIAVLFLLSIVQKWNSYFIPMIYVRDPSKFPLQLVGVEQALQTGDIESAEHMLKTADLIKYAVIIVGSIPVLAIYPFIQKHFVKGVMLGSVKG